MILAFTFARNAGPRHHGRARGFTLVEILITTAVTIVAFSGLVTLQMLSLRSANSAMERTQAAGLAYELIDRMRLNRGENGINDTALGGGYDGISLCDASSRHADDDRTCSFSRLSSFIQDDSVTLDLLDWWNAIDAAGLTHWYAAIQQAGEMFTISVQWDDARADPLAPGAARLRTSCLGKQMPSTMQEICVTTQL